MSEHFSFIMPSQRLANQLVMAFMLLFLIAGMGGAVLLANYSVAIGTIWLGVVLMGGLSALKRHMRRFSSEQTDITLTDNNLLVLNQASGAERQVPLSKVVAFRFTKMKTGQELRLTLEGGQKLKLGINTELHQGQDLSRLAHAFERALARHRRQQGLPKADLREKTFFEKPAATLVLVVLTIGMAWMTGKLIFSDKPAKGSTFLAYTGFFSYAGAWLSARK